MNNPYSLHPNAELLDGYAMNRLPENQTAYVEEHLLLCESCCNALTVLDRDIQLMRAVLSSAEHVAKRIWVRI